MNTSVSHQIESYAESLWTLRTRVRFFATVGSLMHCELTGACEFLVAYSAGERTLTGVNSYMGSQVSFMGETRGTFRAGERFLSRMDDGMLPEVLFQSKRFATLVASMGFRVVLHVRRG